MQGTMDEHPLSPNLGCASGGGDFPPVNYLEWYDPRLEKQMKHDLSQSGLEYPWDWQKICKGEILENITNPISKIPLEPNSWVAMREGVGNSNVTIGHGVSQSLLFALLSVMNPEKPRKVAVEMPSYAPVSQFPRALGCEVIPFWRGPINDDDVGPWHIDRTSLESIIGDVCAVVTTLVQNPTGWMMSDDDQQWLADICASNHVGIVSDEVYLDSTKGSNDYRPMHHYGEHCVSVNSLTKCYGLGPLRFGWIIGSEKVARNAMKVFHNLQGSLATPSLRLAEIIWPQIDDALELIELRRKENLPLLIETLASNGIIWTPPPSGIFGCIPLPKGVDCQQFVEDICGKHDLLLTPCLMFSAQLSNFIRVAWGGEPKSFAEAMEIFNICLQELKR